MSKRNSIAHGDKLDAAIIEDTYIEVKDKVLNMIQDFHDQILTLASSNAYLKNQKETS